MQEAGQRVGVESLLHERINTNQGLRVKMVRDCVGFVVKKVISSVNATSG